MRTLIVFFILSFSALSGAEIYQLNSAVSEFFGGAKVSAHVGGWSFHYLADTYKDKNGVERKYNQEHGRYGLYFDYGQDWTEVGTFINSYGKRSFYASKGVKLHRHKYYYTGLSAGVVSGYVDTEARSSVFVGVNGGLNVGEKVSVDGMLGWGQVNVSLRVNF